MNRKKNEIASGKVTEVVLTARQFKLLRKKKITWLRVNNEWLKLCPPRDKIDRKIELLKAKIRELEVSRKNKPLQRDPVVV